MTAGRFAGALAVACLLLFAMLIVFAMVGLGRFGVVPAVVVAMAFTSRVTKIRKPLMLLMLGLLSLGIVLTLSYGIAIATLLAAGSAGG